jgi:hypothetical protein
MKIIISERQFKRLIKNKSLITENFLDKVKLICGWSFVKA